MNKELIYRLIGAAVMILTAIALVYDAKIALWIGGASAVVAVLIYLMRYTGYTAGDEKNQAKGETVKKMKSAVGLLIVAIVMSVLLYHSLANYLISRWLMSPRHAWIIISILLPFFITAAWLIFKEILPGELTSIRSGSVAVLIVVVTIIGYSYLSLPNDFFDHKTGVSKFWIDDKTGKIYFSPGHSPITGIQLREGAPDDAQKYLKTAPPIQPQTQSAVQTRIVTVNEGRWTPVDLPSELWFDLHAAIDPNKAFWIKLEDGRKFLQRGIHLYDAAGKKADNCMGKNIGNRLLLTADKGQGEFEILISFWSKNPLNMLDGKECD